MCFSRFSTKEPCVNRFFVVHVHDICGQYVLVHLHVHIKFSVHGRPCPYARLYFLHSFLCVFGWNWITSVLFCYVMRENMQVNIIITGFYFFFFIEFFCTDERHLNGWCAFGYYPSESLGNNFHTLKIKHKNYIIVRNHVMMIFNFISFFLQFYTFFFIDLKKLKFIGIICLFSQIVRVQWKCK